MFGYLVFSLKVELRHFCNVFCIPVYLLSRNNSLKSHHLNCPVKHTPRWATSPSHGARQSPSKSAWENGYGREGMNDMWLMSLRDDVTGTELDRRTKLSLRETVKAVAACWHGETNTARKSGFAQFASNCADAFIRVFCFLYFHLFRFLILCVFACFLCLSCFQLFLVLVCVWT